MVLTRGEAMPEFLILVPTRPRVPSGAACGWMTSPPSIACVSTLAAPADKGFPAFIRSANTSKPAQWRLDGPEATCPARQNLQSERPLIPALGSGSRLREQPEQNVSQSKNPRSLGGVNDGEVIAGLAHRRQG